MVLLNFWRVFFLIRAAFRRILNAALLFYSLPTRDLIKRVPGKNDVWLGLGVLNFFIHTIFRRVIGREAKKMELRNGKNT